MAPKKSLPRRVKSLPPMTALSVANQMRVDSLDAAPKTEKGAIRADGWANVLTGIGMAGKDKRIGGNSMTPDLLTREFMESIWRGDDMAARIIETLPNEMLRQGYDLQIQVDPDKAKGKDQMASNSSAKDEAEAIMASLATLEADDRLLEAMNYERAYGGSALLLGADDGETDLAQPLREDRIKSFKWITVLAAHELTPVSYYANPLAPKFGQPEVYRIHPEAPIGTSLATYVEVHESRMVLFKGIKVSRRQMRANQGWGDSVLVRVWQVLSDFQQSWGGAAILLQDFAGAIMKVKDLAELISNDQDEVVIKRAQIMELCRSIARVTIIDAEEDYERKVTPMTGLPEMLEKFALRVAAAADMPVSLLMGQAPAGLNATGDSDIRFFYDRVAARQRTHLAPPIRRIATLVMLAKDGPTRGKVPDNWTVCFKPLWQLDDVQKSIVRMNQQVTDTGYIGQGVLTPEEVAVSRFGGDGYSWETTIDFDGRTPIKPPEHVKVELQANAKAAAVKDPSDTSERKAAK